MEVVAAQEESLQGADVLSVDAEGVECVEPNCAVDSAAAVAEQEDEEASDAAAPVAMDSVAIEFSEGTESNGADQVEAVEEPVHFQQQQQQQQQSQHSEQSFEFVYPDAPIDFAQAQERAYRNRLHRFEVARWKYQWELVSVKAANAAVQRAQQREGGI